MLEKVVRSFHFKVTLIAILKVFFFFFSFSQAKTCVCHICHCFTSYLHTCLSCVYFGCFNPENHMHVHVKTTGHTLGKKCLRPRLRCVSCEWGVLRLMPTPHTHLQARNCLVNKVKFLGLITQKR